MKLHVHVDPDRIDQLRELAKSRGVSTGTLLREGIDRVLELAEKQAEFIEKHLVSDGQTD